MPDLQDGPLNNFAEARHQERLKSQEHQWVDARKNSRLRLISGSAFWLIAARALAPVALGPPKFDFPGLVPEPVDDPAKRR